MIVYCLATVEEPVYTYIGATVDGDRRVRQHNGLASGGAKATSKRPGEWYRVCYVEGFDTWNRTLSFEWHWKHFGKKEKGGALERRKGALDKCMKWAEEKGFPPLEIIYA